MTVEPLVEDDQECFAGSRCMGVILIMALTGFVWLLVGIAVGWAIWGGVS